MRFTEPEYGKTRIKTWFAWLPVSSHYKGLLQTRWLERVTVKQSVYCTIGSNEWNNDEFLDFLSPRCHSERSEESLQLE